MKRNQFLRVLVGLVLFFLFQSENMNAQNYFNFNGSADVLFRYEPRGSGGRALVHDSGNILTLNYGGDFTGGVRIGRSLQVSNGNNYFSYNGGADVLLRYLDRGSGGRAMVHDSGNILSLNHGADFTGGVRIGKSLEVKSTNNLRTLLNKNDQAAISFLPNNGNSIFHIAHGLNNDLNISQGTNVGGGNLVTIKNTGSVGIGQNNPSEKLEVNGNIKLNAPSTRGSTVLKLDRGMEGKDVAAIGYGQNNAYGWYSGLLYNGGGTTPDFYISQNHDIRNGYGELVHTPELTIKTNGNIGIGTRTPEEKLHVNGTATINGNIGIATKNHWHTGSHTLELQNTDAGEVVLSFHRAGHSNAAIKHPNIGGIAFSGNGEYNQTHMYLKPDGNLGIGTTTPDAKLAVNGNIHTREVKVDLQGWPDYVFEDTYNLPTLNQVEQHITEKGHLINIPSAAEVAENGIYLGEMNAKLLEKIEELTLYTIAQEKKIEELQQLRQINQDQNERIQALEAKLEKLLSTK